MILPRVGGTQIFFGRGCASTSLKIGGQGAKWLVDETHFGGSRERKCSWQSQFGGSRELKMYWQIPFWRVKGAKKFIGRANLEGLGS